MKVTNDSDDLEKISIQDLVTMVSIIDTCATRGAFRGEELSSVGLLRDKLSRFVNTQAKNKDDDELIEGEASYDDGPTWR